MKQVSLSSLFPGAQLGEGGAFHTLAKDMSLKEAQNILHFDQGHVLSHPSYNKYIPAPPPLKIIQLRPCLYRGHHYLSRHKNML